MRTLREVVLGDAVGMEPAEVIGRLAGMGAFDWPVISPPEPGGPVYVVTKEAWNEAEMMVLAACEKAHDQQVAHPSACVASVLTALLGNVRVAKAVGRYHPEGDVTENLFDSCGNRNGAVNPGDTVALLEDE